MRNFKKILALLLSLALLFTLSLAITSCGGEEECSAHTDTNNDGKCDNCDEAMTPQNTETSYTVTVKDSNGRKLSGVKLIISNRTDASEELTTDENGMATASLTADGSAVRAEITSVPDGYILPTSKATFAKDATAAEVTVAVDSRTTHTVTVVDEDGNAVAGLSMTICQESCQNPVTTDENGKAVFKFIPLEGYEVKVMIADSSAPYTMLGDVEADGYIHFAEGTTEMTVTVKAN